MYNLQDLDSTSILSPSSDSLSPSTIYSEHVDQYQLTGQEQQYGQVPLYDYGYPTYYQPFGVCYLQPVVLPQQELSYSPSYPNPQPGALSQQDVYHLPKYPDPQTQSISQPYENVETEGTCRKRRVPFTPYQLNILEERYEQSDTIALDERKRLAPILKLTPRQIKVWFQNRRVKDRHTMKQREQKEAKKNQDRSQLTTRN